MNTVAAKIIRKCGGAQQVANWLHVDLSRVYRWTYPKERGGTGGVVPANRQSELLRKARENGVRLDPSDFFEEAA